MLTLRITKMIFPNFHVFPQGVEWEKIGLNKMFKFKVFTPLDYLLRKMNQLINKLWMGCARISSIVNVINFDYQIFCQKHCNILLDILIGPWYHLNMITWWERYCTVCYWYFFFHAAFILISSTASFWIDFKYDLRILASFWAVSLPPVYISFWICQEFQNSIQNLSYYCYFKYLSRI